MIKLTNSLTQDNIYEIINVEIKNISIFANVTGEYKLVVKIDNDTEVSYPYDNEVDLESDYNEIVRIKKQLKND